MSQPDQITVKQAAELLGVSPATVKRLALSGELPPASKFPTVTGGYLFERADVERVAATRVSKLPRSVTEALQAATAIALQPTGKSD